MFIRYKRIKTDAANPKTITELRKRCVSFNKRNSSPQCSDNEDQDLGSNSDSDDDSTQSSATCLLDMHHNLAPNLRFDL